MCFLFFVFEFFLYRAGARKEWKVKSSTFWRGVIIFLLSFWIFVSLLALKAFGAELGPREVVMASFEEVKTIYQDQPGSESPSQVREAVFLALEKYIDVRETARRSLGRPWKEQPADNRAEFVRLFRVVCFNGYSSRLQHFFEGGGEIVKMDDKADGDYSRVVATVRSQGQDFRLEFSLKGEGESWKIYDLSAEGIGLVSNYRSQFSSILGSGKSFADLLELLRSKTGEPALAKPPASGEKEAKKKKRRKGKDEETVLV